MSKRASDEGELLKLVDPTLSADGRYVAFSVGYRDRMHRLGIYDIKNNDLRQASNLDPSISWRSPAFAPDGLGLILTGACVATHRCTKNALGKHIYVMDFKGVHAGKVRRLTSGPFIYSGPRYSVDGKTIFASVAGWSKDKQKVGKLKTITGYRLVSIDVGSGEQKELVPNGAMNLSFTLPSALYEIEDGLIEFTARGIAGNVPSNIKKAFGGEFDFPNVGFILSNGVQLSLMKQNNVAELSNFSASKIGQNKVYIDHSSTEKFDSRGYYNHELFMIVGDESKQLTNLKGQLHAPDIAFDGQSIAFLFDKNKEQAWDIWYLKLNNGEPYSLGLREMILMDIRKDLTEKIGDE